MKAAGAISKHSIFDNTSRLPLASDEANTVDRVPSFLFGGGL
jgi:hypothetical protein